MKVVDMNEVVLTCYVDVWIGCYGLFSYDRFTKYVLGYGDSHMHCTSRPRIGLWVRAYRPLLWSKVRICASWCSLLKYASSVGLNVSLRYYTSMMVCVYYVSCTYDFPCVLKVMHCTKYH